MAIIKINTNNSGLFNTDNIADPDRAYTSEHLVKMANFANDGYVQFYKNEFEVKQIGSTMNVEILPGLFNIGGHFIENTSIQQLSLPTAIAGQEKYHIIAAGVTREQGYVIEDEGTFDRESWIRLIEDEGSPIGEGQPPFERLINDGLGNNIGAQELSIAIVHVIGSSIQEILLPTPATNTSVFEQIIEREILTESTEDGDKNFISLDEYKFSIKEGQTTLPSTKTFKIRINNSFDDPSNTYKPLDYFKVTFNVALEGTDEYTTDVVNIPVVNWAARSFEGDLIYTFSTFVKDGELVFGQEYESVMGLNFRAYYNETLEEVMLAAHDPYSGKKLYENPIQGLNENELEHLSNRNNSDKYIPIFQYLGNCKINTFNSVGIGDRTYAEIRLGTRPIVLSRETFTGGNYNYGDRANQPLISDGTKIDGKRVGYLLRYGGRLGLQRRRTLIQIVNIDNIDDVITSREFTDSEPEPNWFVINETGLLILGTRPDSETGIWSSKALNKFDLSNGTFTPGIIIEQGFASTIYLLTQNRAISGRGTGALGNFTRMYDTIEGDLSGISGFRALYIDKKETYEQ